MSVVLEILAVLPLALAVLLASTVVFDVVHWTLHRLARSRIGALRRIGELHEVHHRFLNESLKIQREWQRANLTHHVIPEYLTQASVSAALLLLLPLEIVAPAFALQTLVFLLILRGRGIELNHHDWDRVDAYRPIYFCMPEYHAWHHVHPEAFFGSWIRTFDHVLGTGSSLRGRRVLLAGADTPLGRALRPRLEERAGSVRIADVSDAAGIDEALEATDVLVLADDGADGAFRGPVEAFCAKTLDRLLPAEVWCVGTAAAIRDASEGARRARAYWTDRRVIYRHLVVPPDALADDDAARRAAARLIRGVERGFNFVPTAPWLAAARDWLRFRRLTPSAETGPPSS
jgi:hypothetical protein